MGNYNLRTSETKYSRIDQVKFVEDRFSKIISLQIFERVSSTNLTRSILEYFVPSTTAVKRKYPAKRFEMKKFLNEPNTDR